MLGFNPLNPYFELLLRHLHCFLRCHSEMILSALQKVF